MSSSLDGQTACHHRGHHGGPQCGRRGHDGQRRARRPKTATFTIQLTGAAEVCPTAPGTCGGPGTGTATIELDRNARTLCYTISTQNVALPLLAAHIHVAPVGQAGPVPVPLFTQPVNAATVPRACLTGLDKNLLKDILRSPQNYYVNVHNAPFANGAVRGQLA